MTRIQCPSIPSWLKEVDEKDVAAHVAAGWVVIDEATAFADEDKPKRVKRTQQESKPAQKEISTGDGEE